MHLSEFDYELPPHLIAQEPAERRDASRLLVVRRRERSLSHHTFADLPDLLAPGNLLVLNDTRVLPARLLGRRARTGGKWEGLFLRQLTGGGWELMCQTRGHLHEGEVIDVEPGPLRLTLRARLPEGHWEARPETPGTPAELLARHGHVPLPPYIRKGRGRDSDRERYQTVFARQPGSVAAPTAGLHFTPEVLERLERRGIGTACVTLHVGAGTFRPIQTEEIAEHHMHAEWGELSAATAEAIAACRARRGRVVAVGTTSVRVLESAILTSPQREQGLPAAWSGETELFIHPPYEFRAVDALVTNFHLPRSSLLVLVSAFAGVDLIRHAYKTAIEGAYRFYSYGDAMLLL
jgi:S-adenosylmethionine:tRNA ribosyltransferase-isomerase